MQTRDLVLAHLALNLAVIGAVTFLAAVQAVTGATAVVVIIAAAGLTSTGASVLSSALSRTTTVEVPKNGEPTVVRTGSVH